MKVEKGTLKQAALGALAAEILAFMLCSLETDFFKFASDWHNDLSSLRLSLTQLALLTPLALLLGSMFGWLCFRLGFSLRKRRYSKLVSVATPSLCFMAAVSIIMLSAWPKISPVFYPARWKDGSSSSGREKLLPSLLSQYKLEGMSVGEVLSLLGRPDVDEDFFDDSKGHLAYRIDATEPRYLEILYDKDRRIVTAFNQDKDLQPRPDVPDAFQELSNIKLLDSRGRESQLNENEQERISADRTRLATKVVTNGHEYPITRLVLIDKLRPLQRETPAELKTAIYGTHTLDPSYLLPGGEKTLVVHESGATELRNGDIFLCGGRYVEKQSPLALRDSNCTWFYNPDTKEVREGPKMLRSRSECSVLELNDGRILVSGGTNIGTATLERSCEILDQHTMKFSRFLKMRIPRSKHALVELNDGNVLTVGGKTAHAFLALADVGTPTAELLLTKEKTSVLLGGAKQRLSAELIPIEKDKAYVLVGNLGGFPFIQNEGQIFKSSKYVKQMMSLHTANYDPD